MRRLPLLLLLAACDPGAFKIGGPVTDTGPVEGDNDGDGHAGLDAGGDDCDDADPAVNPDMAEVWYDGVDQDCDGGSDFDQDADGADQSPTGGDCDDLDPSIRPGATEARDLVDQDCDTLVDEDFIVAGAVLVSEVMHHPLAASDADGEWIELTSTDPNPIDLVGWTITGDDGDSLTITHSLVIEAGGTLVLGPNGNTGLNGGVTVDYVYDRDQLSLSADDTLFLNVGTATIIDIEWTSGWTMSDGASISLDPDHFVVADARQSGYWCVATSDFGSGDQGTPGAANDDCTSLDEDGDGWSTDAGDCDDTDDTVSPGSADVWDGVDNDCSGTADEGDVDSIAVGSVDGSGATGYLSVHQGLGLGDVTGDGTVDLLVGGALLSNYAGAIYVLDGHDADGVSGAASGDAVATVTGSTYSYFGALSPRAGDVDGDGTDDLVVASGGSNGSMGDGVAIAVFLGGGGVSGSLDSGDADYTVDSSGTGSAYGNNRVLSNLDLNGDGLAELVYSRPNANSGSSYYKGEVLIIDSDGLGGSLSLDDADTELAGDSTQDYLGLGLGGADVDGDGYDDLYVGAPGVDDYAQDGGAWYQIDGGAGFDGEVEVDSAASRVVSGAEGSARVGSGAPAFGDFDEDTLLDLAIAGPGANTVWVYYGIDGSASNLDSDDADLQIRGNTATSFGFALAAGDFDRDGADDLVVGAPAINSAYNATGYWYYAPGVGDGEVFLFDGAALGTGSADEDDAWASATGESSGDLFGAVMSAAADIDGDRADDVLVSAPRAASGAGRAYVLRGE